MSFGTGLPEHGWGQDPASQAVGPVSPEDLLTDQSRLEQPMPADSVKRLAGALGHACDMSPSPWADSSDGWFLQWEPSRKVFVLERELSQATHSCP